MRSMFRSVLLALVAVLAVSAVAAASASAEPEWLLNEKPVTKSTTVTFSTGSTGYMELEDEGAGVTIRCTAISGKGTVAPKGAGTITELKFNKCVKTKIPALTCKKPTEKEKEEEESKEWVKSFHLPWKTKLASSGFRVEDKIEEVFGWEWECTNVLGGKTTDKCEGEPATPYITELENSSALEGVKQYFPGLLLSPNLKCSIGGHGTGEWLGLDLIKGPAGERLSVKP